MQTKSFTYSNTGDLAKSVFFSGETIEKRSTEQKIGFSSDHLGNTRVVYEAEWDKSASQVKFNLKGAYDYFPYGKILRSYVPGNGYERYLTTGHERDHETISENNAGTGLDNRGARFYDSDLGRFLSLDPLAADFASWSPYNYVLGNPVLFIDPDGRAPQEGGHGTTTYSFSASAKWSTGILGVNVNVFGIPVSGYRSFGGAEQELSFKLLVRTDFTAGGEIKHTQRQVENGSFALGVGPYGGEEREIKETTLTYDFEKGGKRTVGTEFAKEESKNIKNINFKENSTEVNISGEINALILGVGASVGFGEEKTKAESSTNSNDNKKNQNEFYSPLIPENKTTSNWLGN